MALFDTLKTVLTPYAEKINKHTTDISILSEDAEKINKHTTDISILSEDVENVRADLNEAVDSLNGSLGDVKADLGAIVTLSTNMLDPTNTESGTINSSGEKVSNNSYHRNINYIPVNPSTKYATKNLSVVAEYTSDKTFIRRPYVSETTVFTTSNNCYYILAAGSADVSTWRMNKGETVDDSPYGQIIVNDDADYTEVLENTSVPYIITYPAESGFVSLNDGLIGNSTKRVRSPFINIVQDAFNDKLKFSVTSGITLVYKVCALYKDGVFVKNMSSALYNASGTVLTLNGTFNQFAIAFGKSDNTDFTPSEVAGISISVTSNIALSTVKKSVDSSTDRINTLEANEAYGTLAYIGKKYCALGDSITYGFAPRNCAEYGTQIDSYAKLTAEKLGMIFENYGIVGSTLAYHESRNPMSVRYTTMPNDADIITVMGGTNDIRNGIQLGTSADRTNETYYGALHVLLGGLYKKYFIDQGVTVGKTKKVVVCTPIKLLDSSASELGGTGTLVDMSAWVEAVKEVSAYYSFPVLDFYNLSGINPHLDETIQGTETGYTGFYNPYITDGTHPTQEGQEMMSNLLVGFLKKLM